MLSCSSAVTSGGGGGGGAAGGGAGGGTTARRAAPTDASPDIAWPALDENTGRFPAMIYTAAGRKTPVETRDALAAALGSLIGATAH